MNLLKSFSVTTGLEPKAGYIYEKFYPLDFDKYIVLDTQSTDPNYHYVFWFRAIELMEPILKAHGINIVHFIEDKKYHFNHTYVDTGASLNQKAYIIRNSEMFCGSSKLYSLIASEFNVPQCFLKTDYSLDNTLVSEDSIIHSDKERKNFHNPTGARINNIRPEEIAKKILKNLLNEDHTFDNTLSVGKVYATQCLEIVPDSCFEIKAGNKNEMVIRMDYLFSEENLNSQLSLNSLSIVTSKPINHNILLRHRNNIKKIYYKIDKNSPPEFLQFLEDNKFNYDIITSLSLEDANKEKIKYLNFKKVNKLNFLDMKFLDGLDLSKVYFKTNKIMIKAGKTFASRWHCKNNLSSANVRNESFNIPDQIDEGFKEEADYFYFLTKEQI
jgi:hypothetical protein